MIKKTVTYTDMNGNERTEDFYFNLTQVELAEMDLEVSGISGGMLGILQKIIREKDQRQIVEYFKKIVLAAYGEKSVDGRRFVKSEAIRNGFAPTEAYSKIFMELAQDADAAAKFINGIMPKEVADQAKKMSKEEIAEITKLSGDVTE